jgi:hypothetical protein
MRLRAALVLLAALLVFPSAGAGAFRLGELWQKSFPVGPNPKLEIENVNGNIRVESWAGASIEVTAEIRIKAPSKSQARRLYAGIEFVTESDSSRVRVQTALPRVRQDAFPGLVFGEHSAIRIRYYVKVPRGTSLSVRTVNGDIELAIPSEGGAKIEAHTAHGSVSRISPPR